LFGSGLHDENGDWIYSQQSAYDQFIETCPEEQIECRVSSQHRGRIIDLELLILIMWENANPTVLPYLM
jgi:hypothetical protein